MLSVILVVFGFKLGLIYALIFSMTFSLIAYFYINKVLKKTKLHIDSQKMFISNVAHELNNSMSVMSLNSEYALRDIDEARLHNVSAEKSQELIGALRTDLKVMKSMAYIIKNLSLLASQEYRLAHSGFEKVNLTSLLGQLCELTEIKAKIKNIDLKSAEKSPYYIWGNESSLTQLINNLLNNAIKYTPEGGKVHAGVSASRTAITLSIKDTGIGMSDDDMKRIFKPFYRSADSLTRKEEGSGLGLAIVSEIAKQHKAMITINSALRGGTEILISFPKIVNSNMLSR